jgi:hypothetical protein
VTVPVAVRSVRHQCPFCRRTWGHRAAAAAHIARCWHNPEARACKTCVHYEPTDPNGPYPEHPGWPEACFAGQDITAGLATHCTHHATEEAP